VKRLIPNVVWLVSVFAMFCVVGYYDASDFWFFDYQWDYAFCCGFACTGATYGIGTLCAHWVDKIKGLR
jgi:hypothetical protein